MLRTTQNKIYRQGDDRCRMSWKTDFPTKPEELFKYDGLIIGSVEANYFSTEQQQMIRDFADRRGGGVLFLAGRFALSDGGLRQNADGRNDAAASDRRTRPGAAISPPRR